MKPTRHLSKVLLILALGSTYTASAEDIDIFTTTDEALKVRPNVLLVLDNAASNNSSVTMLDGTKGNKLEMLRQVLNNILDPFNSPYFPACAVTGSGESEVRVPAKCVTKDEVRALVGDINLGLMLFNPSTAASGGYVRSHVRRMDEDANRASLLARVNNSGAGIPQANNSPYAKTMHEAFLYYSGRAPYVGFDSNQYDHDARNGTVYVSPATESCQDNYILFVGNGGPDSNEETESAALLRGLSGVLTTDPVEFTPNNLVSSWFDEYGRTLKKRDINPNLDGIQNITTYTIAVQSPDDSNYRTNPVASARQLLRSAANLGGGEYYEANDGQQVMRALLDMLRKFQPEDSVFSAATLPVSVNARGTFLNQVYMGQFRPDENAGPRWPGNLKLYQIGLLNGTPLLVDRNGAGVEDTVNGFILPDKTSFWTTDSSYWDFDPIGTPPSASDAPDGNMVEKGGAAQRMRQTFASSQTGRNLYTCNGACTGGASLSTNLFDASNSDIKPLVAADSTEATNIINWMRGADNIDNEDSNGVATDIRARVHGDLLHSRPAVVNYNRTAGDRDIVVYYGTNGGVFHAVKGGKDDADGAEKWGMVFPEFLPKLKRLRDNRPKIDADNPKPYFADGPVSVFQHDANDDGRIEADLGDKVYLYVGMRRGGRFAYALDVSNPDNPKHLWKIDHTMTGFEELGQTWSTLRPSRIRASGSDSAVIFGAGYDPENEDTEVAGTNTKGRGIFVVNGRTGAKIALIQPDGMGAVPGDLAVLDRDNDGMYDRIYAADTKGNIWRVDIDDADPANWRSYKLAALGGSGENARKFLNKPDVVFGAGYDTVLIGSGDREHPFENSVTNRLYMVKDTNIGLTGGMLCDTDGVGRPCTEDDLVDVTSNPYQNTTAAIDHGWYLTLAEGEKVVGSAITVFGTAYFPTNQPTPPARGMCSSLGIARMYAVGIAAGTATVDTNADGVLDAADRSAELAGGGFPPTPVYARVEVDGKQKDIVCTGAHCVEPPAPTATNKRFRTYWHIEQ